MLRFFLHYPPPISPPFSWTTATGHVTGQPRRAAPLAARAARVRSFCYKWAPLGPIITAAACMRTRTGATSRPRRPLGPRRKRYFGHNRPSSEWCARLPLGDALTTMPLVGAGPWPCGPCRGAGSLNTLIATQQPHVHPQRCIWKLKSQKLNREK